MYWLIRKRVVRARLGSAKVGGRRCVPDVRWSCSAAPFPKTRGVRISSLVVGEYCCLFRLFVLCSGVNEFVFGVRHGSLRLRRQLEKLNLFKGVTDVMDR